LDFDSFNSIEVTVALGEKLKKDIPLTENLCWDNIEGKPRNVQDIAQVLLNYPNSPE
jgi:acyl carrier protein